MKNQKLKSKLSIIMIGYGEIGKAIYEVFSPYYEINIIAEKGNPLPNKAYDIMLVTIPYTRSFVRSINEYKKHFIPRTTIIFSTVQIGTCSKIGAVHSPIEGKHPHLAKSILTMARWIGGNDPLAIRFFRVINFKLKVVEKPEITESLKLTSTSLYGLNIEFARYRKKIADKLGFDFKYFIEFDKDYNDLYNRLDMPEYSRYLLTPPVGKIGGHCVVPNADILSKKFPNILLDNIVE